MKRLVFIISCMILSSCHSNREVVTTTRLDKAGMFNTSRFAVLDDVITVFDIVSNDSDTTMVPKRKIVRHAQVNNKDTVSFQDTTRTEVRTQSRKGEVSSSGLVSVFFMFAMLLVAIVLFTLLLLRILILHYKK